MASIALGAIFLASCQPKAGGTSNSASITPAPLKVIDTIWVPGKDDLLHPKKVSFAALDTQLKSGGNPIPALDEIVKLSPAWFPKGTRVMDVKDNGKNITLLLSPEFGEAKHWQKGEKITELAVYSLVNTLAKDGKTVSLTLEGKPISTLGELDAGGELEAELDLNAAPAATTASDKSTAKSETAKTEAPKTEAPEAPTASPTAG